MKNHLLFYVLLLALFSSFLNYSCKKETIEPTNHEFVEYHIDSIFEPNSENDSLPIILDNDCGTIIAWEGAKPGDTCTIDCDLYTVVDSAMLYDMVANNEDVSKVVTVDVDTVDPLVKHKEWMLDSRKVSFVFDVEESYFDEIVYIDEEDRRPRWKRLCSRLDLGRCDPTKSFRRGPHKLDIVVFDEAGNSASIYEDLEFIV